MPRTLVAFTLLSLTCAATLAAQPLGGEFQVNSYTTSNQRYPAVAGTPAGGFVVVWQGRGSSGSDSDGYSIRGQRFASDGTAVGSEFQVNSYTTGRQSYPAVGLVETGDFVVVWQSQGSSGSDRSFTSIQGQRFASDGTALASQFQINSYTNDGQSYPAVAMASSGDFVVVWESQGSSGSDGSSTSIQGQRFASNGTALASQFQVNTYTNDGQSYPAVAMASSGDFVVMWQSQGSSGSDSSSTSIQGQRFASDGTALASQFQVNSYTSYDQNYPAVAMASSGDFVVVWDSWGVTGPISYSYTIEGQRFASDGTPVASQFQINSYTSYDHGYPAVAMAEGGDFLVVWDDYDPSGSDGDAAGIGGQRFAADGTPVASEFQINSFITGSQRHPAAGLAGDDFVVVWQSYGSAGSDLDETSIQGQRWWLTTSIFSDGFESGDTSKWSSTLGGSP